MVAAQTLLLTLICMWREKHHGDIVDVEGVMVVPMMAVVATGEGGVFLDGVLVVVFCLPKEIAK